MYTCIKLASSMLWRSGHRLLWKCSLRLMHSTMSGRGWSGTWNIPHWTVSGLRCINSTMSGGACTHDSSSKDNLSTMSGGGCLLIDMESNHPNIVTALDSTYFLGIESSIYNMHNPQWNTLVSHDHRVKTICTLEHGLKQFETVVLTRQSNDG